MQPRWWCTVPSPAACKNRLSPATAPMPAWVGTAELRDPYKWKTAKMRTERSALSSFLLKASDMAYCFAGRLRCTHNRFPPYRISPLGSKSPAILGQSFAPGLNSYKSSHARAVKALSSVKAKFPGELVQEDEDFLISHTSPVRSPALTRRSTSVFNRLTLVPAAATLLSKIRRVRAGRARCRNFGPRP